MPAWSKFRIARDRTRWPAVTGYVQIPPAERSASFNAVYSALLVTTVTGSSGTLDVRQTMHWATANSGTFRDWPYLGHDSGTDAEAYLVTGYLVGDSARHKYLPYLTVHCSRAGLRSSEDDTPPASATSTTTVDWSVIFLQNFETTYSDGRYLTDNSTFAEPWISYTGSAAIIRNSPSTAKFGDVSLQNGPLYYQDARYDLSQYSKWSVHLWHYRTSNYNKNIMAFMGAMPSYPNFTVGDSQVRFYVSLSGTYYWEVVTNASGSLAAHYFGPYSITAYEGSWHHFALTCDGTYVRAFLDGSLTASISDYYHTLTLNGRTIASAADPHILFGAVSVGWGLNNAGGSTEIDAIQVVQNTAIWTASFSPPAVPPTTTSWE